MIDDTDAPTGGAEGVTTPEVVETISEATTEQEASTETEQQADEAGDTQTDAPKRKPWWEQRFGEMTAKTYEQQRRAERAEAELARLTQSQAGASKGPPTQEEYGWDDAAYSKATADYNREQAKAIVREEMAAEEAERQQANRIASATNKVLEAGGKYPDFAEVVKDINVTDVVIDLLNSVPNAVDVLYQVGKDPNDYYRIFSLPPIQQAAELGRLSARLETPKPTNRTIAPAPPQTVSGLSAGMTLKSPAEMSMTEYAEARKKGLI